MIKIRIRDQTATCGDDGIWQSTSPALREKLNRLAQRFDPGPSSPYPPFDQATAIVAELGGEFLEVNLPDPPSSDDGVVF